MARTSLGSHTESAIQESNERGVWRNVLHSLQVESTSKSHKSSEGAGDESSCVCVAILLLKVSAAGLVIE
jgi:hypothetical protein